MFDLKTQRIWLISILNRNYELRITHCVAPLLEAGLVGSNDLPQLWVVYVNKYLVGPFKINIFY